MVTIVIPAFNEEKMINHCLEAIAKQQTTRQFEVIVVDNNSADATVEKAKIFKNTLDLRVVIERRKGRGAARKKGFEVARGSIILSTDADTIVPAQWLETLVTTLEEGKVVAVSGTCKIHDCGPVTNAVFNFLQPQYMRLYRVIFGHYWLSGFNFAIYKEAYDASGGFNGELNAQEDVDLSKNVAKIGKIKFINNLPVIFSGRRFRGGLLKGLLPYVTTFAKYFFFKRKNITLSDVR